MSVDLLHLKTLDPNLLLTSSLTGDSYQKECVLRDKNEDPGCATCQNALKDQQQLVSRLGEGSLTVASHPCLLRTTIPGRGIVIEHREGMVTIGRPTRPNFPEKSSQDEMFVSNPT